jgi:hypothetical protein
MPNNAAVMWTRRRISLHSNRVAFKDGFVVANSRLDPASGESLSSPLWVSDRSVIAPRRTQIGNRRWTATEMDRPHEQPAGESRMASART